MPNDPGPLMPHLDYEVSGPQIPATPVVPGDVTPRLREGVKFRETGWHGSDAHIDVPPEHPLRAGQGDLSMQFIPGLERRPLGDRDPNAVPFKNLRQGK